MVGKEKLFYKCSSFKDLRPHLAGKKGGRAEKGIKICVFCTAREKGAEGGESRKQKCFYFPASLQLRPFLPSSLSCIKHSRQKRKYEKPEKGKMLEKSSQRHTDFKTG